MNSIILVNMIIGKRQLIFGRPSISIVIRTLNEERYLPKVLTAIRAQKNLFGPTEIIIVDSGSTIKLSKLLSLFTAKFWKSPLKVLLLARL